MVEQEYLPIEPDLDKSIQNIVDWLEDGDHKLGFRYQDGSILVNLKSQDTIFGDTAKSIIATVCSTYPKCSFCTERAECPVSNFKKQPWV